jgi:hypothetical protein
MNLEKVGLEGMDGIHFIHNRVWQLALVVTAITS